MMLVVVPTGLMFYKLEGKDTLFYIFFLHEERVNLLICNSTAWYTRHTPKLPSSYIFAFYFHSDGNGMWSSALSHYPALCGHSLWLRFKFTITYLCKDPEMQPSRLVIFHSYSAHFKMGILSVSLFQSLSSFSMKPFKIKLLWCKWLNTNAFFPTSWFCLGPLSSTEPSTFQICSWRHYATRQYFLKDFLGSTHFLGGGKWLTLSISCIVEWIPGMRVPMFALLPSLVINQGPCLWTEWVKGTVVRFEINVLSDFSVLLLWFCVCCLPNAFSPRFS